VRNQLSGKRFLKASGFSKEDINRIKQGVAVFGRYYRIALALLIAVTVPGLSGCRKKTEPQLEPQLYKDKQAMMGTFVEVISPDSRAGTIVMSRMRDVERRFSVYDEDSDISRLNKYGVCAVAPETYKLLIKAKEYWLASDGAFDITVGPLMELWGFRDKELRRPSDDRIREVMAAVGTNKIIFHTSGDVVEFSVSGMKVDCGAIAKGYAVDCAVSALREAGVSSCLINAGGDIYCLGNRFGKPWNVAIQDPGGPGMVKILHLVDKAVATSGDYEQYFTDGGVRFSHIMDPVSGYPAKAKAVSVTVVAGDCLTADFLATTGIVLGKNPITALAKRFNADDVFVIELPDPEKDMGSAP
jgi:thiamine biosynthesis lipoprotein